MSARYAARSLVEKLPISRPSQYICRHCRQNITTVSHAAQQKRFASDDAKQETFLEKTRKKLWQGQPPGPENVDDLYGGPGFFATAAKERRERRARELEQRNGKRAVDGASGGESATPSARSSVLEEDESVVSHHTSAQVSKPRLADQYIQPRVPKSASRPIEPDFLEEEEEGTVTLAKDLTSWEGLETVGHQDHEWDLKPVNPIDDYTPWQVMDNKLTWSKDELVALMAIAVENTELETSLDGEVQEFYPGDANIPLPSAEAKEALLATELSFERGTSASQKVLSRFSYLVRRRVPDNILTLLTKGHTSSTIGNFLEIFAEQTKPKPTKVAEVLKNNEKLGAHNNLLVLGRRETPVDREKEGGRWKVIEAELKRLGLPVLGRLHEQRR